MPTWTPIADVEDCPPGEARELVAVGRIIALFNVDGEYFALDGMCPHQGGPLGKGKLTGCIITCPWHGFQFDVRDGQHQSSQQLRQPTFPVKVEDGRVFVELPD
jgi:nitrite reductase/ring-hydroxylating ferredoxin subunit